MNKILIILFFFISSSLQALEFSCDFEEVHSNGTVNQGLVLLKKDKLRYEYLDNDLFIIFVDGAEIYILDKKKQKTKNIKQNLEVIEIIMQLANQYPDIKKSYNEKGVKIKIENNQKDEFIKRISIDSKRARLSLYFKNCILDKPVNNIFFKFDPVFEYN